MRILVVATKTPWPPTDGGRLVLWLTLQGLAQAGHKIVLVVPAETARAAMRVADLEQLRTICEPCLVDVPRRSLLAVATYSLWMRRPFSVARHESDAIRNEVVRQVSAFRPDVIHAEQLQSLANCRAVGTANTPLLLRMQNVESDLWIQVSRMCWWRRFFAIEGRRLHRFESRAIAACDQVVALTHRDVEALKVGDTVGVTTHISCVAPTFVSDLPAAAALTGDPALVLTGSSGWWPNTQGGRWFLETVWPKVWFAFPGAQLHIFGGAPVASSGVQWHSAPVDSASSFPVNAIAIVPLHVASGIRMRILEAWARGVPVLATTVATRGLAVESFRELIIADTAEQYVDGLRQLMCDDSLRSRLVGNGRAYLRRHHECSEATRSLLNRYARAVTEVHRQARSVLPPTKAL